MLAATILLILFQIGVAAAAPARFMSYALWIQCIPYTWNWDSQIVYNTPIGPLNVISMQYFGFMLACLISVMPRLDRALSEARPYKWHAAFVLFCAVSLVYAPSAAYGLRMLLKLLGPLLFMIVVLTNLDSEQDLKNIRRAILGSGVILVLMAIVAKVAGLNSGPNGEATGMSGLGPPSMGPAVFSAHMLPVAMLALSAYLCKPKPKLLFLTLLSAMAVMGAFERTSLAALYVGFSVILFIGARGLWRFLGPVVGLFGLPAMLLLNETFRRRMFFGDTNAKGLLSDPADALAKVNGSGRFELWDSMLNRFYSPHPIRGSGVGATENFFYGQAAHGTAVAHSEYVRLLCEVGLIGLFLFVATALSYLRNIHLYRIQCADPLRREFALAAMGSFVTYLLYCSTDNAFDYISAFGIYVFALIAAAAKASTFESNALPSDGDQTPSSHHRIPNLLT